MASSYKALAMANQLHDKLVIRIGSKVHDVSFDTDSNPLIAIDDGTPAAGEKNALIKILPDSWPLAKDVLGNTALQFVPHVVQVVMEAPAGGAGQTFLDCQLLADILGECFRLGAKLDWYQSANGDAPSVDDIIAVNLVASFYPDVYNKLTSQQ